MTPISFFKMHSLGNDFIVIDAVSEVLPTALTEVSAIVRLCDRHEGVGCDQVMIVRSPTKESDFDIDIYNSDGACVEQCGNGVRCVYDFLRQTGISEKEELVFQLMTTKVRSVYAEDKKSVRVFFQASPIESTFVEDQYTFSCLNLGNPHAVCLQQPSIENICTIGVTLNQKIAGGINVGFLNVVNRRQMNLCVYERGAGMTKACGSGAMAATIVAYQKGLIDDEVKIQMPGGELLCGYGDQDEVWLQGEVNTVFSGTLFFEEK